MAERFVDRRFAQKLISTFPSAAPPVDSRRCAAGRLRGRETALQNMVKFLDCPASENTHAKVVTFRGAHTIFLEDADLPLLLEQAQPELPWVSKAPHAIAYGDFADLVLRVATVEGDTHTAILLVEYIVKAAGLGRIWGLLLGTMTPADWTPTSKGVFIGRLGAARRRLADQTGFSIGLSLEITPAE